MNKLKIFSSSLFLLMFLSTLAPSTPNVSIGFEMPYIQKGICYVTWEKDRFLSEYSDKSLKRLTSIGVRYIQIVVTQYQENLYSTKIHPTQYTPSDESILHAINKSHELGMKVMLKPHVDLIDTSNNTYNRSDIGFASEEDWREWFSSYQKFILHYAKLSQETGVEIFCIGTELSFSTQKNDLWEKMVIGPVRNVYTGKLIYAANWDNYENIEFWHKLDYVGIDAYFPLTNKKDPSLNDLSRGWRRWEQQLRGWHSYINKPIIFTEIGYPSASHAPSEPWKSPHRGNADADIQTKCYKAFFNTVWGAPWLKGVYWWKWNTSVYAGGRNNRHFTPQNKPAEKILEQNYRKIPQSSMLAMASHQEK